MMRYCGLGTVDPRHPRAACNNALRAERFGIFFHLLLQNISGLASGRSGPVPSSRITKFQILDFESGQLIRLSL
jgi:hypothetical protein